MKYLPLLLIISCVLFPCVPNLFVSLAVIVIAAGCMWFFRKQRLVFWLCALLSTLPLALLNEPNVLPPDSKKIEIELEKQISLLERPSFLETDSELFSDWEKHEEEIYDILERASRKTHIAYTLADLNLKPRIWSGTTFSDDYRGLIEEHVFWIFKDNRAILAKSTPFPDQESRSFNLISELLVISGNELDRPHAWYQRNGDDSHTPPIQWMSREFPDSRFFQPVFTLQRHIVPISQQGIMDALPMDVQWVRFHDASSPREWIALVWVLSLFLFIFLYGRSDVHWESMGRGRFLAFTSALILLFAMPLPVALDYLEVFSNSLFAAWNFGNLLASPFHLLIFFLLLYLLLIRMIKYVPTLDSKNIKSFRWLVRNFIALPLFSLVFFPFWIQSNTQVSLCHPKEAFLGTGSFLVFFSALMIFCLFIHLLLLSKKPSPLLIGCIQLGFFLWTPLPTSLSAVSLWLIIELNRVPAYRTRFHAPWIHRALTAMLVASIFYFQLVTLGNRDLHEFIETDWLQEATLVDQENHNRVMRILDAFKTYQSQYTSINNSYLASWLAKISGLSEEAVEYSLWITNSQGDAISTAENKISIESIDYGLFPKNRIEYLPETPDSTRILVFRRPFEHQNESGELIIAITDSFQNLISIQRISSLFQKEGLEVPFKHGTVALKVYDPNGNPLNDLENPIQIPKEAFDRLKTEPFFTVQNEGETRYFFNDNQRLFMISVRPVAPIFLLARYLLIFFFCWSVLTLLHRSEKLKKRTLHQLYTRSFRFRLATLFFSVSLFPIVMLLVLFFGNFTNGQIRQEINQLIQQAFRIQSTFDPNKIMQFKESGDISLFENGSLEQTTYPELFRSGMLSTRIPYPTWKKLLGKEVSYSLQNTRSHLPFSLNAVYLVQANQTILGITHYANSIQFRETLENKLEVVFSLTFLILIGTSFFALNFSRVFMRPIASITRAATKMQRSVKQDPIPTYQKQNDLNRMIHAFNAMQEKITWNEKERQKQIDLLTITLETMKTGLIGLNPQKEIILCNKAFFTFFPNLKPEMETMGASQPLESHFKPRSDLNLEKVCWEIPNLLQLFHSEKTISHTIKGEDQAHDLIILCRLDIRQVDEGDQDLKYIFLFEDITPEIETSRLKAWSEMARRIAHEIKNPLTPIQLEIDHINALYRDRHPKFGEALSEASTEITTQIRQLHKTATEFGDYARPMALDMKKQCLLPIIQECCSSYERTQDRIKLELRIKDNPEINLDVTLTKKAISNLLINSYEAMEQGRILIQLEIRDETNLLLTIEDNGPGIEIGEKDRIFEAYFSTKTRGTGLGLAITKKSFEAQGVSITLDSGFLEGTRFMIRFPLEN